ncbi:hypothetical protein MMC14_000288 [Varicellaria rhodocarpa]|nr:hypothetical protein [Varicellaria rhodocarpa]
MNAEGNCYYKASSGPSCKLRILEFHRCSSLILPERWPPTPLELSLTISLLLLPLPPFDPKPLHHTSHQLDSLTFGPHGAQTPRSGTITPAPTAATDLEASRPPSPTLDEEVHPLAAEAMQSLSHPPMNKYRLLSVCLMNLGSGLNDSTPGALLPYIERHYSIGYAIVSLIFVANAAGFIGAVPFTHLLLGRLGRARMLVLAQALLAAAYVAIVCTPPFPVVVVGFFFVGLGSAWSLALNNVFCANLANSTTTLGFFHGSYGIGGTVGPLVATALVTSGGGRVWSRFYFVPLGVTLGNAAVAFWTFRKYEIDFPTPPPPPPHLAHQRASSSPSSPQASSTLRTALRNRTTLLGAAFIFAYQGAEVSISGWVISFLLSRSPRPTPSIGYVTAGFWAGITLGRFALSHPAHKLGEKRAIFILLPLVAAFQLLVWLLPNVVAESVAVAVVGLLLGPVYPCATVVFCRLLGRALQTSGLSFVSAMGSSGGALAPFVTGMVAQRYGTWVLHPVCLGLFGVMGGCWGGLGGGGVKRRE